MAKLANIALGQAIQKAATAMEAIAKTAEKQKSDTKTQPESAKAEQSRPVK